MAKKKRFVILKQAAFVTALVATSVTISGGVLVYANELSKTSVETLSDISGSYQRSIGYSSVSQEQETSDTGLISTTIKGNLSLSSNGGPANTLAVLRDDIQKVNTGELVNVDMALVDEEKKQNINIKYYASSSEDYADGSFNSVIDTVDAITETRLSEYDITVRPGLNGRHITVEGSLSGLVNEEDPFENKDDVIQVAQKDLLAKTDASMLRQPGDVFDVTFIDEAPAGDEAFIPLTVQTIYDSDSSFEQANNLDFPMISKLVMPGSYSYLAPKAVKYVNTPSINSGQLIVVINDEGEGKLQEINQNVSAYVSNDVIWVPEAYDVIFRYSIDGLNKLTYSSYYSG
jgi:hypothetical protein